MVKATPDGFNTVSGHIIVPKIREALEFYGKALGAEGGLCMAGPGDTVMHAEMRIGNSTVMLAEENEQWGTKGAKALGGTPVSLHIYCDDVDASFKRAVDAGCEVAYPVEDAFWGDRFGMVLDPYGLKWAFATHKEDLTEEEIAKRGAEWMAKMAEGGGEGHS